MILNSRNTIKFKIIHTTITYLNKHTMTNNWTNHINLTHKWEVHQHLYYKLFNSSRTKFNKCMIPLSSIKWVLMHSNNLWLSNKIMTICNQGSNRFRSNKINLKTKLWMKVKLCNLSKLKKLKNRLWNLIMMFSLSWYFPDLWMTLWMYKLTYCKSKNKTKDN